MDRPIVLVGAGRSGTKFLRDTLAASASCRVIPFDVNYVWRTGHQRLAHDALTPDMVDEADAAAIRRTLDRLATPRTVEAPPANLVEKTVSNSLRVAYVHAVLPEARFVHLVRDGRAVAESAHRMWREPPEPGYLWRKLRYFPLRNVPYALWYVGNRVRGLFGAGEGASRPIWGPRYPGIEADLERASLLEVCALQWRACVERALEDFGAAVPPERVITVRYEDLVRDDAALRRVCDFLELPDPERVAETYARTLRGDTRNKWRSLGESDLATLHAVLGPTLERSGYL